MTDLATLVVKLEAETSQYRRELQNATGQIQKFSTDVGGFAGDIAKKLAGAFAFEQLAEFTKGIIEQEAALGKLAQVVGTSVESLSQLQGAAKISGIDDITISIERFSKSLGQSSIGAVPAFTQALKDVGVKLTSDVDGHVKTTQEVLLEFATRLSSFGDGYQKMLVVQEAFGRGVGPEMVAFLNQGGAGIEEMMRRVNALGGTVTKDGAEAAENFEKSLRELKIEMGGVVREGLNPILSALAEYLRGTGEAGKSSGALATLAQELGGVFKLVATAVVIVSGGLSDIGKVLGNVAGLVTGLVGALGNLAKVDLKDAFKGLFTDAVIKGKTFWDGLVGIAHDVVGTGATIGKVWGVETPAAIVKSTEALELFHVTAKKKLELTDPGALKSLTDLKDHLEEQIATFGQVGSAAALYSIKFGKIHDEILKTGEAGKVLEPILIKLAQHMIDLQAAEKQATANDQLVKATDELEQQVATFGLGRAAADEYNISFGKLSRIIADAGKEGKKTAEDYRALSIELQRKMDTRSLQDINIQMLDLTGNTEAAARAQFDLQQVELRAGLARTGDKADEEKVNALGRLIADQARYNALQNQASEIDAKLSLQLTQIAKQQAVSGLSDLDVQKQEAVARKKAIDDLNVILGEMKDIGTATTNPAIRQGILGMTTSITGLQAQTEQTAKSIRDNFSSAAETSFSDFVTGAKSASDAVLSFLTDIEKSLVDMVAKKYFQQLFSSEGSGGGIISSLAGLFTAAAMGGPVRPGLLYQVGEMGPELFVPDVGARTAVSLTEGGTRVPFDAPGARVIGKEGPEYIKSSISGIVIPTDKFLAQAASAQPDKMGGGRMMKLPGEEALARMLPPTIAPRAPPVVMPGLGDYAEKHAAPPQRTLDRREYETLLTDRYLEKRARGGAVEAGQPYLVGEEGPEVYVPSTSGTIVPHMGGPRINMNFVIQAPQGSVSKATQIQIAAAAARAMQSANSRNN